LKRRIVIVPLKELVPYVEEVEKLIPDPVMIWLTLL